MRLQLLIASIILVATMLFIGLEMGRDYGARALVGILEDEAQKGCRCAIVYDDLSLSLLTLTAKGRNVRLVSEGRVALRFEEIEATFSLSEIRSKVVHLTHLILRRGHADGVGDESPTFKFIDQLTTPPPPEKRVPGRWRLRLDALTLEPSTIREEFNKSVLKASGAELYLKRDGESFHLYPKIEKLEVVYPKKSPAHFISLGGAEGGLTIHDDYVEWHSIKLSLPESQAEVKAVSNNRQKGALEGTLQATIDAASLALSDYARGKIELQGDLSGRLGSPISEGSIRLSRDPLELLYAGSTVAALESLTGRYLLDVNRGKPIVRLSAIEGRGQEFSIIPSTFELNDETISGHISLQLGSLEAENLRAQGVTLDLSVNGNLETLTTHLTLSTSDVQSNGSSLGPAKAELRLENDSLAFKIEKRDRTNEADFTGEGTILLSQTSPFLKNFTFALHHLEPPGLDVSLHGTGEISGPLSLTSLKGTGDFALLREGAVLSDLHLKLSDMILGVSASNPSKSATLESSLDLSNSKRSEAIIRLEHIKLGDPCSDAVITANYSFSLDAPRQGDGKADISRIVYGCEPYEIAIAPRTSLPIRDGVLFLDGVEAKGPGTSLKLAGEISLVKGFTANAKGELELESFLQLVPSLDQLSGRAALEVHLSGPLSSPSFNGEARLRKVELTEESSKIGIEDASGVVTFDAKDIVIESFKGGANGGELSVEGKVKLDDLASSKGKIILKEVSLEPAKDISLVASADIEVSTTDQLIPLLKGTIDVLSADLRKNIDLATLADLAASLILETRTRDSAPNELPPINLDLKVGASRNLFITTNWLEAELKADLKASGTLTEPAISGSMESISGWFGLRDRRFDITTARLGFHPPELLPHIDLLSEASILTRTGEKMLIMLEANGPFHKPKITFSSDRGLSQREILALLTTNQEASNATSVSRFGLGLQYEEFSLIDRESPLVGNSILYKITKIDSLSLEPTYNSLTGSVEPSVLAEKKITDELSLVGQSLFASTANQSQVKLNYALTDDLDLSALAQSIATRPELAFGIDLGYTVWSSKKKALELEVVGNNAFSNLEVLGFVRLSESSEIAPHDVQKIKDLLLREYRERGYFDVRVEATCEQTARLCQRLVIKVSEGRAAQVRAIQVKGPELETILSEEDLRRIRRRGYATSRFLSSTRDRLLRTLREKGYIAARVSATYKDDEERRSSKHLVLEVEPGKPVSFSFTGNSVFTAEELLQTVNLLERKHPFGNNSITILIDSIEAKYREAGYLFATSGYKRHEEGGRVLYTININEEKRVTVSKVSLIGNKELSSRRLRKRLQEQYPGRSYSTFSPLYAIEEEIALNVSSMTDIFHQEGFPKAQVAYAINPLEDNSVEIAYHIVEGERKVLKELSIEGLPDYITAPPSPQVPLSHPIVQQYGEELLSLLREAGHLSAKVTPKVDNESLHLVVDAGPRTTVESIHIRGETTVSPHVILSHLGFEEKAPWDSTAINAARRSLLKLGLFSRVELGPEDGVLDEEQEALVIKVTERALRSLRVGTGVNSEFGLHLFSEAIDRSFFRDGRTFSLRADTYYDPGLQEISQGSANILFTDPELLQSDFSLVEDVRFQKLLTQTQEFDVERLSNALYLYRSSDSGLTASFGHTVASEQLTDVAQDAVLSQLDRGRVVLSFVSGELTYDRRDDPLNPRSGYSATFDYKLSSSAVGSDANFYSLGGRISALIPLRGAARRFTLGVSSRIALAEPFGDTEAIPITHRFYLGGRTTVRGFRENSLGPRGRQGAVIGGDLVQANTLQLQYMLTENLSLHTFLDSGNVFIQHEGDQELERQSLNLGDQRLSTGVGLHYLSPIGPVGFDVGHPLNEKPGEPSLRVHFSIGTKF